MSKLGDSFNGTAKTGIVELVRIGVAVFVAIVSSIGTIRYIGPNEIIKGVDEQLLQKKARPLAYTSVEARRDWINREREFSLKLESELSPIKAQQDLLKDLVSQFSLKGPDEVNRKLDILLEQLKEAEQSARERHKDQMTHFNETNQLMLHFQQRPSPWGR